MEVEVCEVLVRYPIPATPIRPSVATFWPFPVLLAKSYNVSAVWSSTLCAVSYQRQAIQKRSFSR